MLLLAVFAPFFVMDRPGMKLQGALLFLFGPFLASQITPNLQEQASVWCFFRYDTHARTT